MNATTSLRDRILSAEVGAPVLSGGGSTLVVAEREHVVGGWAERAVITGDGGVYIPGWHVYGDDGDTFDAVYVERWGLGGREFHGWIDRKSRKLVQTG